MVSFDAFFSFFILPSLFSPFTEGGFETVNYQQHIKTKNMLVALSV